MAPPTPSSEPRRRGLSPATAPLVPAAVALTTGIVLDRAVQVPMAVSAGGAAAGLFAWMIHQAPADRRLGLLYLLTAVASVGCLYHHWYRYTLEPNDVSHHATTEGVPIRLRGAVASHLQFQPGKVHPLRSWPGKPSVQFILCVQERQVLSERVWIPAAGKVQVSAVGGSRDLAVGDEVELLGRLALPPEPANPGEFDYGSFLRDQGITATLAVLAGDDLTVTSRGWSWSLAGWLARLRGHGQQILNEWLPPPRQPIAAALLLGDSAALTTDAWDRYLRTGVMHVLAISGQHLVILGGFLWLAARTVGLRRRRVAVVVALVLLGYALLTGGRPSVMRAAWTVAAYCLAVLLQRPGHHLNILAFAWVSVLLHNPTDVANTGCQLSFAAVAVLILGVPRWTRPEPDTLQRVIDESRPLVLSCLVTVGRWVALAYIVNAILWLAVTPLVADRYHVVSWSALLIGPPMVLLASIALLAGFLLLLVAPWSGPLAWPFALTTHGSLAGCDLLVGWGNQLPASYTFVPDVPAWWLVLFYLGLAIALFAEPIGRHPRALLAAGLGWLAVGIVVLFWPHRPGEFRCSFLAVGHGGCTVLESPGGHVTLYDDGAITGPDVTRRHIAPFLWRRGIRRVDDVIVSHADLDHFNGIPALLERFRVGRVICTPTFAQRTTPAVGHTLAELDRAGIPSAIVSRGERWQVDGVHFQVLHPPPTGPAGNENARSLVLRVTYRDLNLLLTGDLEDTGLTQVLELPAPPVDVLMAPHHGSERANVPALASWAAPRVVVSCQAMPRFEQQTAALYQRHGASFLATWRHGTVTVRHDGTNARVETFRTQIDWPLSENE